MERRDRELKKLNEHCTHLDSQAGLGKGVFASVSGPRIAKHHRDVPAIQVGKWFQAELPDLSMDSRDRGDILLFPFSEIVLKQKIDDKS